MIRRHANALKALLMLVDGLLAVVLLVALSYLRFGDDWGVYWREVVRGPKIMVRTIPSAVEGR